MDSNQMNCIKCHSDNISRICMDCGKNAIFCDECYIKEHSGPSSQYHTTRHPKFKAFISDSGRNSKSKLSLDVSDTVSDDLLSHNLFPSDTTEKPNFLYPSKINSNNASHPGFQAQQSYSNNIDHTIHCPDRPNFLQSFSSTVMENQCNLFESGKIRKFNSIEEMAKALQIEKSLTEFRVPIVTFIGKPVKEESVANMLLLTNNTIKFVEGRNKTSNPLCSMIYDSINHLLILETQNMHKEMAKYIDEQNVLRNLFLALSDVIIFCEGEIPRDYIRIHEMMKNCKTRFGAFFSKIDKVNPERLAPGLVYLQLVKSEITDNLSTTILNVTDRKDLFSSYNQIIFFDVKKRNNSENFHTGLTKILSDVSKLRNEHSLEEILFCINNCEDSSSDAQNNLASNDIPNCWFFCNAVCQICQKRCVKSFDHRGNHANDCECLPDNQNEVYFCKQCINENLNVKGKIPLVLKPMSKEESFLKNIVSYSFRRSLVECDTHGIIYDNNWLYTFYNMEDKISTEYYHKWPGEKFMSEHVYPMGQIIIDKVNEISDPIVRVVTKSTEYVSDSVQPIDWESTSGTSNCKICKEPFTKKMAKHHCRICKFVICSSCCHPNLSARVCKVCFDKNPHLKSSEEDPKAITILNIVRDSYQTCSSYLRRTVVNLTRPDYWENDEKAIRCFLCSKQFHCEINPIHHCRACGKCVCDKCSQNQRPVEWRCLSDPSRICDKCQENKNWKKPLD